MNDYEVIANFLRAFLNYEFYSVAVEKARQVIATDPYWKQRWLRIATVIRNRDLFPGQPLALVNAEANQVIDENSDEEAYVWLDLMIRNIERADGKVEEY